MNSRDGSTPPADSEAAVEQRIQDAGLTAPRITPADIDAQIVREDYHVRTVCVRKRICSMAIGPASMHSSLRIPSFIRCPTPSNNGSVSRRWQGPSAA